MSERIAARKRKWFRQGQRALAPVVGARLRGRLAAWFERSRPAGARAAETPKDAEQIADRVEQKVVRQGKLRQAWSDIQVLVRLVRAWARGEYRDVSRGTIALVLGSLVYFLAPLDAIFDQIPLVGYIDDAAVLAWVISEVRTELDAFKAWEARQLTAPPPQPALAPLTGPSQTS